MKFSYRLLKKYLPELPAKRKVVSALNLHVFEAEDLGGDVIDVSVSPNRYSDAGSHIGLAKELAIVLGLKQGSVPKLKTILRPIKLAGLEVKISAPKRVARYSALVFDNISVKQSPAWIKSVLKSCGLKPVNNVVDLMNLVMLETGQPLHAFDFDKISVSGGRKSVEIRLAKKGEVITTLDGNSYNLDSQTLLIADSKQPLAIAGIKGGKAAEVNKDTKRILVEAANFDGVSIYQTVRHLNLTTDASSRFTHNLHPALTAAALNRVKELKNELGREAKIIGAWDSGFNIKPRLIKPDITRISRLLGLHLNQRAVFSVLKKIGLKPAGRGFYEIPILRQDLENQEDLAEEVVRLIGYEFISPQPPLIGLMPTEYEEMVEFKDKLRLILAGFGFDEVYNSSFNSEKGDWAVEIANPIAEDKKYLRPDLLCHLDRNITHNLKFFDDARIFEVGQAFNAVKGVIYESGRLGLAVSLKANNGFFELKGVLESLFESLGIADFLIAETEEKGVMAVKTGDSTLGYLYYLPDRSLAEIDLASLLAAANEDMEFRPLPLYPAVVRDISLLADSSIKVGDLIQEIQLSDLKEIEDVDLIDEYFDKTGARQSVTLRVVFRADDHTLTSEEVDRKIKNILSLLLDKFGVEAK